jgi:hypothetical protein
VRETPMVIPPSYVVDYEFSICSFKVNNCAQGTHSWTLVAQLVDYTMTAVVRRTNQHDFNMILGLGFRVYTLNLKQL